MFAEKQRKGMQAWLSRIICLLRHKYLRGPFSIIFSANFQLYT